MSEIINNREVSIRDNETEDRKELIKQILKELHRDEPVDQIKERYRGKLKNIKISEMSQMEHELMEEEGIPPEDVRRVCSAHTDFFKETFGLLDEGNKPQYKVGHPVHTFFLENQAVNDFIEKELKPSLKEYQSDPIEKNVRQLVQKLEKLYLVDKHYDRKENLLFPFLEKYGIYGPSTMMWRLDDDIRASIKKAIELLKEDERRHGEILINIESIIVEMVQMIFREENILLPMAIEKLSEDDWIKVRKEEHEIGYTMIDPPNEWKLDREDLESEDSFKDGVIKLETGVIRVDQLELMMNHLPVDITFIDENDVVRYFSHGKNRVFVRTKAVIGRTVQNCHPPHSVHMVEELLADFKAGRKDVEDFWIKFRGKYVLIRYFAVRDEEGKYKGTLEFTQDIQPIQEITGEKRLMS